MLCKITHCTGHVLADTRLHQLHCDWEMGRCICCLELCLMIQLLQITNLLMFRDSVPAVIYDEQHVSYFPLSGPPSKPTTPVINATTIQTLTSFSVDFGSSPIRFFLLNITEYPNGSPNTLNISADDTSGIIRSLSMFERRRTVLAYYVEIRLSSQLNNQVDYAFAVAAENDIGVREFSIMQAALHA